MSSLEHAIAIAAIAHGGDEDKLGNPFILHPLRVMLSVDDPDARIVAVLHDVLEKTGWSAERLVREGFAPRIVRAVRALTREGYEDYEGFVERAAADQLARIVKIADLRDNIAQVEAGGGKADTRERKLARWRKALERLGADPEPAWSPAPRRELRLSS